MTGFSERSEAQPPDADSPATEPARSGLGTSATGIALVGCGYVADLYLANRGLHRELSIIGVYDRDPERTTRFAEHYGLDTYDALEAILADPRVEIVVNLTNPASHFEVSAAALQAGKHVYSEKPLAMHYDDAAKLVSMARARGLQLCGAPCNVLSESAQTFWRALRSGVVGRVRAIYAELDDGMLHRMPYKKWISASGTPWPYKDEFEVGCTLEHAGYYVSWLAAFFGPVRRLHAFASTVIDDKVPGETLVPSPDLTVAGLEFDGGIVARLTCSIVAEHDHALKVYGDDGVLFTSDCWFYKSPVYYQRRLNIRRKAMLTPWKTKVPMVGQDQSLQGRFGAAQMDFFRGVGEMATALKDGRPPRMSAEFSLHVTEIALAIHNASTNGGVYLPKSTFEPMAPMPWAR